MKPTRWPLGVLTSAALVLAAAESAFSLLAPSRVATDSEWESAAAEARASLQEGDLIVFAPTWVDPVGRLHLGDRIPVDMAARADADRYRRVWELSIRGARAPETARATLVRRSQHGRVSLALYEKQSVAVVYDFTSHVAEARVTEATPRGDERPCYLDGDRAFRCAGVRVEPRTLEVDYLPRRGILAPVDGDQVLRVEFDDVELGRTLAGYTGLADFFSRKNADGLVGFRVLIDGVERLRLEHANDDGWRRFSIDTAGESGRRHRVGFEIFSRRPEWRTFGFHAEARI